ncbi:MAG: DNA replication/repair protein RecF [Candidatus Dormibacteraceae bacterium]
MRLSLLSLRNYRNYARLDLELSPGLNVFLGRNAQGKTNLLESVALLALSSSPRARRESELIGPVASEARIEGSVEGPPPDQGRSQGHRIEISVRADGERARRTIRVNGLPRRAVDLPGHLRVTLFWPDDLDLVKSGPDHRRRLLNELLVQIEAGHARDLSGYRRVLEQRNSLLKQVAAGDRPPADLDVWDLELATIGRRIAMARATAVAELEPLAAASHRAISGGEELRLLYQGPPEGLLEAVQKSRPEDLRRGVSGIGPHRDDVAIVLNGEDARSFASQGQQRTAVVSLKLAEADLIMARTGAPPVLLLDDVLSELDPARRAALLAGVGGRGQVIITSVEASPFSAALMGTALVRCITEGSVAACA